jgi:hypothetical protein
MKLKVYEHLFLVNQGYDQVARSLKTLARYPALRPAEVTQFAQLAEESRAATNSHFLDLLAALEINHAGRLSRQRRARERKEDQPGQTRRETQK